MVPVNTGIGEFHGSILKGQRMTTVISKRIRKVRMNPAQGDHIARLIPIEGPSHDEPAYRLLEGDVVKAVKVTEVSEAGSVPHVKITNMLDARLFLVDGQELIGAKQNRMLNTDVLVPAGATLNVPVSCIEAGRWRYTAADFSAGKAASYRVRRRKSRRVHESLRRAGRHDADQHEVWQEVDEELAQAKASSRTSALRDAYAARQKELVEFRRKLKIPPQAVGMAVFCGTEFRGLDLFDRHTTLRYFWESLVDSYAIDWLGRPVEMGSTGPPQIENETISRVLNQAAEASWESFESPGEGQDYRLATTTLNGSALVWDEQVVLHLQLFPHDPKDDEQSARRRRPRRPLRRHARFTDTAFT